MSFVLVTFARSGVAERSAQDVHVVHRLADVTIELETRRDDVHARPPPVRRARHRNVVGR